MRLMVQVHGHWLVGIADWQGTLRQEWQRRGWEQQNCETRLEAK